MFRLLALTFVAVLGASGVCLADGAACTAHAAVIDNPQYLEVPCLPGAYGAQAIAGCMNCPGKTITRAHRFTPVCERLVPEVSNALVAVAGHLVHGRCLADNGATARLQPQPMAVDPGAAPPRMVPPIVAPPGMRAPIARPIIMPMPHQPIAPMHQPIMMQGGGARDSVKPIHEQSPLTPHGRSW